MSRIERALRATCAPAERTGLVTYVTAGDPDLPRSAEILKRLDRAGADVLEVGVPFSDPLADGPVIQRATERALAAGHDPHDVLGHAEERPRRRFRPRSSSLATPIRYFGWGWTRFVADARAAGVDGVLTLDMPPEEGGDVPRRLQGGRD